MKVVRRRNEKTRRIKFSRGKEQVKRKRELGCKEDESDKDMSKRKRS